MWKKGRKKYFVKNFLEISWLPKFKCVKLLLLTVNLILVECKCLSVKRIRFSIFYTIKRKNCIIREIIKYNSR